MRRAIQGGAFLLFAAALAWEGCASRKGGAAVLVVTDPEVVRGCAFLGRVSQTTTESEPSGVGVLRQRTAELGGNTLLLRAAGTGEAWNCSGAPSAYAPPAAPSPTRSIPGLIPTAPATPRY